MAQDYAKRKKPNPKKSSKGLPAWVWLFTGIVSGLFIAFLIYLSNVQLDSRATGNTTIEENANATQADTKNTQFSDQIKEQAARLREGKEALKKPTFTFYDRLPQLKVETPKPDEIRSNATAESDNKKTYLLQAGSFRSFQDADSLKAQLIMQGLEVNINSAKDSTGNDWHRVRVGPYVTQNSLNKAQDILANENIPSMLMEVK